MNLQDLIKLFRSYPDCEEYVSVRGNKCLRPYAYDESYFFFLCRQIGFTHVKQVSDFYFEAKKKDYELSYCEHDIVLAIINKDNDSKK